MGKEASVRYQLKAATLPIVAYDDWEPAKDRGKKRNWWKAENLAKERERRYSTRGSAFQETLHPPVRVSFFNFQHSSLNTQVSRVAPRLNVGS